MTLSRIFIFLLLIVQNPQSANSHSYRQSDPKKQKQQKLGANQNGENGIFGMQNLLGYFWVDPGRVLTELPDPIVHCGVDSMLLDIRTQRPFWGRVFVKGFSQQSECQLLGNGTMTAFKFGVQFERCGLRRSREINGISVATVVVVSFHPLFITKLDSAFRLSCFYTESRKTVAQQLEVGQLSTAASIRAEHKMPTCSAGKVYHRWSCHPEETPSYCMRVHSCTVSDGQGGEAVEVLDRRGCAVDGLLIRDLEYSGDLSAGQSASVFKFADKPTLHFNCQIELTQRDSAASNCSMNRPKCGPAAGGEELAKAKKTQKSNEIAATATAADESGGGEKSSEYDESYGANRSPAEPFTTRWNFAASGLFGPPGGIVTDKSLQAAQFRLAPNKSEARESATLAQTQVKPSGQTKNTPEDIKDREFEPPTQRQEDTYDDDDDDDDDKAEQDRRMEAASRARRGILAVFILKKKQIHAELLGYRRVADFDLPDRSLVVIDVDEQHIAPWRQQNASSTTFTATKNEQCHFMTEQSKQSPLRRRHKLFC
uniref:ZP domain-containing protein n=1 Tax=Globodera pallida TaxID=36090 RepID=A0A183BJC6_GLOPA